MNSPITYIDQEAVKKGIAPKPADQKDYLVLLEYYDDEQDQYVRTWEYLVGRSEAYLYIYDKLTEGLQVYLTNSIVLVESNPGLHTEASAYEFMKYCHTNYFPDPSFNPDEYLLPEEIDEMSEGDDKPSNQFIKDGFNVTIEDLNITVNTKESHDINRSIIGVGGEEE